MVRADSGYYRHDVIHAALTAKAWYSVTVRMNPAITRAIAAISEDAWTTINYKNAIWDDQAKEWISTAQMAETRYTAFNSYPKQKQVSARLVVRRVPRLNPDIPPGQGELFPTYRHHAFLTNSTLTTVEADARHRDHALVEQVIADLKNGPLAHAPSGRFAANGAWLALAAIAYNLLRAAGIAAGTGHTRARWNTLRGHLITIPARIASSARQITLHLPTNWPWQLDFTDLWVACLIPSGVGAQ